jgi:hypothetical protein
MFIFNHYYKNNKLINERKKGKKKVLNLKGQSVTLAVTVFLGMNVAPRILLVFFCYLLNYDNMEILLLRYIKEIQQMKLLEQKNTHLVVSLSGTNITFLKMSHKIRQIFPTINITFSEGNSYEYPGIHSVWSRSYYFDIVGYSHCKGISRKRSFTDFAFRTVIFPWKKVVQLFSDYPSIDRVGYIASNGGWAWFNFWWARGVYVMGCPKPRITSKYYYESYLGLRKDGKNCTKSEEGDCFTNADNFFSIALGAAGIGVNPSRAAYLHQNKVVKFQ